MSDEYTPQAAALISGYMEHLQAQLEKANAEAATIKEKYMRLAAAIQELKDALNENGEYSICRSDREPMGIGECIFVGNILERISAELPAPAKGAA